MAKDNAVQNQKVFVTLEAVLQLQAELHRASKAMRETPATSNDYRFYQGYRNGLHKLAETLGLPIVTQL